MGCSNSSCYICGKELFDLTFRQAENHIKRHNSKSVVGK